MSSDLVKIKRMEIKAETSRRNADIASTAIAQGGELGKAVLANPALSCLAFVVLAEYLGNVYWTQDGNKVYYLNQSEKYGLLTGALLSDLVKSFTPIALSLASK